MFITISKSNDRYGFIVGDDPTDPSGTFLFSQSDSSLIPGASKDYPTFREAHSHAVQVVEKFSSLVLSRKSSFVKHADLGGISPEDSAIATLEEQPEILDGMLMKIKGDMEHQKKDRLDALLESIDQAIEGAKAIQKELNFEENEERIDNTIKRLNIVKKSAQRERDRFGPETPETPEAPQEPIGQAAPPPASPAQPLSPFASKIDPQFAKDCLKAFGEAAAQAIDATHGESYLKYIEKDKGSGSYQVILADSQRELCVLSFNSDLLLDGVYPSNDISKQSSYHSPDFFERYWEPIVHAVGHYASHDIVVSPNHPQSKRRVMAGWNLNAKRPMVVSLTIPKALSKTAQTWSLRFAEQAEQSGSQGWDKAQVRCTKQLPTYYQRTGVVQSVINRGSYLDINVDFGRGLGVVTMTNNDLEKITTLS